MSRRARGCQYRPLLDRLLVAHHLRNRLRRGSALAAGALIFLVVLGGSAFSLLDEATPASSEDDAPATGVTEPTPDEQDALERAALPDPGPSEGPAEPSAIRWRRSQAIGRAYDGRLIQGVQLPPEGEHFFTWDPIRRVSPNRGWRRHGTDRLVRVVLDVLGDFRRAHPTAPRIGIGDLSRPHGGDFGPRFGAPGHASHQNGLDVDVYYPRTDGIERAPTHPASIDRALSQDLVDRFVRARAQFVFVGFRSGLRGARRIVQRIPHHENHMHVRIYNRNRQQARYR